MSNGSEPNLSSRGGNPSLAASSGFELDESDDVEVQPLPFQSTPALFRPLRSNPSRSYPSASNPASRRKVIAGQRVTPRKEGRDIGERRSGEEGRGESSSGTEMRRARIRKGSKGRELTFRRESLPIKVLQVPVLRIVPVLVEGILAVRQVPLAVETCARSGKVSKRKTTRSSGGNDRRTVVVPPVGPEACPPGCEEKMSAPVAR